MVGLLRYDGYDFTSINIELANLTTVSDVIKFRGHKTGLIKPVLYYVD